MVTHGYQSVPALLSVVVTFASEFSFVTSCDGLCVCYSKYEPDSPLLIQKYVPSLVLKGIGSL